MKQIDDADVFSSIHHDDLWCLDKLILAKKLGYVCGPAGVAPPAPNTYIVRPVWNLRMMSAGATIEYLDSDTIPHGYFWCELFAGRHCSFDYHWGKQVLAVEGFRADPKKLTRFNCWTRVTDVFILPQVLQQVADRYEWFNVETVDFKVIEAHFRYNDDFAGHTAHTITPVWKDEFYHSLAGDRLGFILHKD